MPSRSRSGRSKPVSPLGTRCGGLKVIATSVRGEPSALPDRSRNGTPAQRQVSTVTTTSANVSVLRAGSTPSSSAYEGSRRPSISPAV
jgi:hypothetical protein